MVMPNSGGIPSVLNLHHIMLREDGQIYDGVCSRQWSQYTLKGSSQLFGAWDGLLERTRQEEKRRRGEGEKGRRSGRDEGRKGGGEEGRRGGEEEGEHTLYVRLHKEIISSTEWKTQKTCKTYYAYNREGGRRLYTCFNSSCAWRMARAPRKGNFCGRGILLGFYLHPASCASNAGDIALRTVGKALWMAY